MTPVLLLSHCAPGSSLSAFLTFDSFPEICPVYTRRTQTELRILQVSSFPLSCLCLSQPRAVAKTYCYPTLVTIINASTGWSKMQRSGLQSSLNVSPLSHFSSPCAKAGQTQSLYTENLIFWFYAEVLLPLSASHATYQFCDKRQLSKAHNKGNLGLHFLLPKTLKLFLCPQH